MNSSSLDWSIESTLSSLFPPFEATAPTVLSQLFRTIDERFNGDTLQCLLDYLIPAKHILESVQQAACAEYSDVLFQCEGWPLCLRDRVVIQLAPINPLLLRPGDFYLQVEPFGEQSARIVLKSLLVQENLLEQEDLLLQAGFRVQEGPVVEETPIPETSYPCIFSEAWLKEVNEERHNNQLHQCVLSSDHGIVKVPWTEVVNPKFLDRPKVKSKTITSMSTAVLTNQDNQCSVPELNSQLIVSMPSLESKTMILPPKDEAAVSGKMVEGSCICVNLDQGKSMNNTVGKPVGWVSPSTWDSRHNHELEGEYVDLLYLAKEKDALGFKIQTKPSFPVSLKPAPPLSKRDSTCCVQPSSMMDEHCSPCSECKDLPEDLQKGLGSKGRYRQSYIAAIRNPLCFDKTSMLEPLNETWPGLGEAEPIYEGHAMSPENEILSSSPSQGSTKVGQSLMQSCKDSITQDQNLIQPTTGSRHLDQNITLPNSHSAQPKNLPTGQLPKDLHKMVQECKTDPVHQQHCLSDATRNEPCQMRTNAQKHAKTHHLPKMGLRALPDRSRQEINSYSSKSIGVQQTNQFPYGPTSFNKTPLEILRQPHSLFHQTQNNQNILKNQSIHMNHKLHCENKQYRGRPVHLLNVLSKNRPKPHSASSVSDTVKECLLENRPTGRSRSDVCPEIIPMVPEVHVQQSKKQTSFELVSPKHDKRKELKKDEATFGTVKLPVFLNGDFQLQILSPEHGGQPAHLSQDPTTKSILQLGIICLPGSRDRAGRAVIEVYGWDNSSTLLSSFELCKLVLYLYSIPRREVRELGLTVVIDSRNGALPSVFYKALVMVQEQVLHAVHSVLLLVDKDQVSRPETLSGLQVDIVTSLKPLHKYVDGQQLTSKFGGTFTYNHTDWLHFYQKLSLFELELQGAALLLQKAIRKLDSNKKTGTAKDVKTCIQEQMSSMKEVLQDTQMVTLQRVGGTILARLQKEELEFAQSEDYSNSIETTVLLYNQMEEGVHALVMKSNQSLQHLEHVLLLRETEEQLNTSREWCEEKASSWLKDTDPTLETRERLGQRLSKLNAVFTQAKEKKEKALSLMKDVKRRIQGMHYPETDMFHINMTRFKTDMAAFLLQAEQHKSELQALIRLHLFCEQALALTKECSHYLEHMEMGCYPVMTNIINLKSFHKRFKAFSPENFELEKSKTMPEKHQRKISVWNQAWFLSQNVKKRLEAKLLESVTNQKSQKFSQVMDEMLSNTETSLPDLFFGISKSSCDDTQVQSNWSGAHMPMQKEDSPSRSEAGTQFTFNDNSEGTQVEDIQCSSQIITSISSIKQNSPNDYKNQMINPHTYPPLVKTSNKVNDSTLPNVKLLILSHEHQSEIDLRSVDLADRSRTLGCASSEGSCIKSLHSGSICSPVDTGKCNILPHDQKCVANHHSNFCSDISNITLEWIQMDMRNKFRVFPDDQESQLSQQESFCSSVSIPSQDWIKEREMINPDDGVPESSSGSPRTQVKALDTTFYSSTNLENNGNALKLQHIIEELLQTEREYVRALSYVMEHYFPELERLDVPQDFRGQRGSIFGNLDKLREFHQHHFLKDLELCLKEPFHVGRCFLRHKESFGLYALYSKNKPHSDHLLTNHGKEFFKHKQQQLGDMMNLSSYLLKPVQRISKYSLLLKEMLEECESTSYKGPERAEIQDALEVIQFQLRHGNNLLAMDDIQECDVNLKEQGQLIRQDEFLVSFRKKKYNRHIFLFKELILFSKTKKTEVGNDTYIYKQSFKTSDIGMTHTCGDSGLCFEIWFRRRKSQDTYTIQARSHEVKEAWTKDLEKILWEQAIHNREIRVQERVFMGIGHNPIMDSKSISNETAICDRAINCIPTGQDCKASDFSGRFDTESVQRPISTGAASYISSCSHSSCSSSSGWSSLSPFGNHIGHIKETSASDHRQLEECYLDQENAKQNLLIHSSESFRECDFRRSGSSCQSVNGGEHSPHVGVTKIRKPSSQKTESNHQEHKDKPKTFTEPLNQTMDQTLNNIQENNHMSKSTEI